MTKTVSVIIPNWNGASTIGRCLEAVLASDHASLEVIVVDDNSEDDSVDVIQRYPCTLIRLGKRKGAAAARNEGARRAAGDVLFFTDADCLLGKETVSIAVRRLSQLGNDVVLGGTYTVKPDDEDFFSAFQSAFIQYSETKTPENPDYVATHAMAVSAATFRKSGGFDENFMVIVEDVELSHRMRKAGVQLVIDPAIQVRHVFGFSLFRSLRNAFVKARYWTAYSIRNRDLLTDSGTASVELKVNVGACFCCFLVLGLFVAASEVALLWALLPLIAANLLVSQGLLNAFYRAGGVSFAVVAALYYVCLYPMAVGAGALSGAVKSPAAGLWKVR